jgi:hypothetical protein
LEASAAEFDQLAIAQVTFALLFQHPEVAEDFLVDIICMQQLDHRTETHKWESTSLCVQVGLNHREQLFQNHLVLQF